MTSLKAMAKAYKQANPDAAIADFIQHIIDNKQACPEGKAIAYGFWQAISEDEMAGAGSYRFS